MTIIQTITKNVVKREWRDIEPKLIAALIVGVPTSAIIAYAASVGFVIPPGFAGLITLAVALIGGWAKASTTKAALVPALAAAAVPALAEIAAKTVPTAPKA